MSYDIWQDFEKMRQDLTATQPTPAPLELDSGPTSGLLLAA